MLATVMNAVCLQSILEDYGLETRLQTALEIRVLSAVLEFLHTFLGNRRTLHSKESNSAS